MCDVRPAFLLRRVFARSLAVSLHHDSGQFGAVAQADGSAAELGGSKHRECGARCLAKCRRCRPSRRDFLHGTGVCVCCVCVCVCRRLRLRVCVADVRQRPRPWNRCVLRDSLEYTHTHTRARAHTHTQVCNALVSQQPLSMVYVAQVCVYGMVYGHRCVCVCVVYGNR